MTDLLTIDQIAYTLATTEPLTRIPFSVGDITFRAITGQHHGMRARTPDEPTGVYADLADGTVIELNRQAYEELCSLTGLRPTYVTDCPAHLIVTHLNHWYTTGLLATRKPVDFQFIVRNGLALAFTKQSIIPFSNLKLLDQARTALSAVITPGTDIVADSKIQHDLRKTTFRLIPTHETRTTLDGQQWSVGIQVRNSLTGRTQTTVDRYLFNWTTLAGQIDSALTIPPFTRRATAGEDEAYAWARHAMDDALTASSASLDAVAHLQHVPVPRDVSQLLKDVFEHYRIPLTLRGPIIDTVIDHQGDLSMYEIMTAISTTANQPGLDPTSVDLLMRVAGRLPYTGESCKSCDRLIHNH